MAVRAKVRCVKREVNETGAWIAQAGPNIGKAVHGDIIRDGDADKSKYLTGEVVNGTCHRTFTFQAVYSDDPAHPNHTWSKFTPVFELKMVVTNADVDFEVGREYNLDFTRSVD